MPMGRGLARHGWRRKAYFRFEGKSRPPGSIRQPFDRSLDKALRQAITDSMSSPKIWWYMVWVSSAT
jgi:hypothetical protein